GGELGIHRLAEGEDALPLVFAVGLGDPGVLVDAGDFVEVTEGHLALVGGAGDGGGGDRIRGAGEGDMTLPGEQPRGGIEPHPAGAGDVYLAPGVEVGEVPLGARGSVEGVDVGGQLHQIAGGKARGEPQVAEDLHQQPAAVPTGALVE